MPSHIAIKCNSLTRRNKLKILRKIGINIERIGFLRMKIHFAIGMCLENLLMTILRILFQEMLMARQYVLHQAVLVSGPMWTKGALELRIDSALEIVMPLQMVFMLVSFSAGDAGMFEYRNVFRIN